MSSHFQSTQQIQIAELRQLPYRLVWSRIIPETSAGIAYLHSPQCPILQPV